MDDSLDKFLKDHQTIDVEKVSNFRRDQIFLSENPTFQSLFPLNWIRGGRRGQRRYGKERLQVLKHEGDIIFLEKYPINRVGNPHFFEIDGLLAIFIDARLVN